MITESADLDRLASVFGAGDATFPTSPLYRALSRVVAADRPTLALLAHRRPGQQPPYLFFGAVHDLLLRGDDHPLREFYPSIVGAAARSPEEAGPVLIDFCRTRHDELSELIRTRLVQTNVVRRVIGLRCALRAVAQRSRQPVHLIEVGTSAGLHLSVDRYRYLIGDRAFGRPDAEVTVDCEWHGAGSPPDLDDVPPIASRTGVDLNPVDVTDAEQRRWLRALVWPEDRPEAALLEAAIGELVLDPPRIITGDAIDVCPALGRDLPPGEPRVVFHAATRMHVPVDRRVAFDEAIDAIGDGGPLYHAWIEPPFAPHHPYPADDRGVLALHGPGDRSASSIMRVEGHLHWLAPVD
jgi:hypothetical protein